MKQIFSGVVYSVSPINNISGPKPQRYQTVVVRQAARTNEMEEVIAAEQYWECVAWNAKIDSFKMDQSWINKKVDVVAYLNSKKTGAGIHEKFSMTLRLHEIGDFVPKQKANS